MDIRLPDTDGLMVTKELREHHITIPIIAQTAHAMGEDRSKCLDAGANEYLAKPINITNLMNVLDRFL
jgi:CheY-like chemotaxis protein